MGLTTVQIPVLEQPLALNRHRQMSAPTPIRLTNPDEIVLEQVGQHTSPLLRELQRRVTQRLRVILERRQKTLKC